MAAARELPHLSLLDALELTMLIARKDSRRYPRVAARWLQRLLEEHPDLTIEEAALAASSLVALPGASYREAAQTLGAMAKRPLGGRELGALHNDADQCCAAFGSLITLEACETIDCLFGGRRE